MNHSNLPPIHRLLPTVRIEESVLRHSRTLFYSATKNHECLANLSVRATSDPTSILISALLPSTYAQRPEPQPSDDLVGSELVVPTTHIVPLFSIFDAKPPPSRRPTQITHSLLSLFPPSASCQANPPLQLHVSLPNVRINLSDPTDLHTSAIKLVKNSIYILANTGQITCNAGVLLSSVKRKASSLKNNASLPVETLEPASFNNSSGANVAGVWIRGNDASTTTLSLHSLAAAWWTRRNRRLSRVPPSNKKPSGDWFERRVWLVCFQNSTNQITVQSGTIAVCDDQGVHFVASLSDSSTSVDFEPQSGSPVTNDSPDPQPSWEGWDSGWVTMPTAKETQDAKERYQNTLSRSSTASTQNTQHDVGTLKTKRFQPLRPSRPAGDMSDQAGSACRGTSSYDSGILSARMRTPNYHRATGFAFENPIPNPTPNSAIFAAQTAKIGINTMNNPTVATATSQSQTNDISPNGNGQITDTFVQDECTSDGELEENNINMDDLCKKYLNSSYNEVVQKHVSNS